ncbi:MAG: PEP-CTERM system histidine kinase PrsK [Geothermobacteraceae bacterium]
MTDLVQFSLCVALVACYGLAHLRSGSRGLNSLVLLAALLAVVVVDLFDILALQGRGQLDLVLRGSHAAGALVPGLLALYVISLGRRGRSILLKSVVGASSLLVLAALIFPARMFYFAPDFDSERLVFLNPAGFWVYLVRLLLLMMALVALERTLAALPREQRWLYKYELVGLGIMGAALLCYDSQGLFYRSFDFGLITVRRLGLILGVGLMWIALRRIGSNRLPRFGFSREMAFQSTLLILVGGYLLLLGGLGQALSYFGESWKRLGMIGVGLVSGAALVAVLLSERARRRIQDFLQRHFYADKYNYRGQWLAFTEALANARGREDLNRTILNVIVRTLAFKGAALFLADRERGGYRRAQVEELWRTEEYLPPGHPLCTALSGEEDCLPRDEAEQELASWMESCQVFVAVPLRFKGRMHGFILAGNRINAREDFSREDSDLLEVLAFQATASLMNQDLSEELGQAREMGAMGRVATFVMHDLKNLVSNLGMLTENARIHMDNPEFRDDMLETLENSVAKMSAVIERLQNLRSEPEVHARPTELYGFVRRVLDRAGLGGIAVCGEPAVAAVDAEAIEKVIINLAHNAREASGGLEGVEFEIGASPVPFILCRDHGCGMSESFVRDKLFTPFCSTKSKGFGIGMYQSRRIVRALGGEIDVTSRPGEGTTFRVVFPAVCAIGPIREDTGADGLKMAEGGEVALEKTAGY